MKKVFCILLAAALLLLAGCAAAENGLISDNSSGDVSDINDMPLTISFASKDELAAWFKNGGKWEEAEGTGSACTSAEGW